MKKGFKGFTLVECIIAMAILGIASLLVAQIYAAVSTRNKMNNLVNSSLVYQMSYVEKYTNSDIIPLYFGGSQAADPEISSTTRKPPHKSVGVSDTTKPYVVIQSNYTGNNEYSYPADIYVLKSRDRDGNVLTATGDSGYKEADYNLRYKYLLGHK